MLPAILLAAAFGGGAQQPQAQPPPPNTTVASPAPAADSAQASIETGLKAFRKRNFRQAEIEFRKALDADAQSAAAHFYLGYTYYKIGEPARRMNEHKEKAKAEFAKAFELEPAFRPVWGSKTGSAK